MISSTSRLTLLAVLAVAMMMLSAMWEPSAAPVFSKPDDPNQPRRRCIILWMAGGPSQLDTFDPKNGAVSLFKAIDTNVKGVQFTELFPKLAKQANHLAVIRSMTHADGDHARGTVLMQTGQAFGGPLEYPRLGSVLAKELGDRIVSVPRYVCIDSINVGRGFLDEKFAPLKLRGGPLPLPSEAEFEALDKMNGKAMRKAVVSAFDLGEEKPETRDRYGNGRFGQACLLARRLSERGVSVVEVTLGGWDIHANAADATSRVGTQLDDAFSSLVQDLHDRKLLEQTLIVCMGEFGRTPRINGNMGRDHYPAAFTTILAGAGIKGGQAIGKTSDDGAKVAELPVSPQQFHATIYRSLGIDPLAFNRTSGGEKIPLVPKGTEAVKEALLR